MTVEYVPIPFFNYLDSLYVSPWEQIQYALDHSTVKSMWIISPITLHSTNALYHCTISLYYITEVKSSSKTY